MTELSQLRSRIAELERAESTRQQAAGALRASETRFRRLFEAARDGVLILDAETGQIDAVNPFLTSLLGYSEQEMLGKALWDIGPFKDERLSRIAFRELQAREYIRYDDLPLETRDGRPVAVEFVSNVYLADQRKVIQCNIRDITERKRVAEALRQSGILNRSLVESLPHRIFVKDRQSNYLFCNASYARDLKIEPGEIVGRDDFAFFSTDLAEQYRTDDREVMSDGNIRRLDERYTVAGEERWVRTVKLPYRDEEGTITGVMGLFEDITEHKRAEGHRELLAALVEASPDFIGFADAKTAHIRYINKGGRRMCGIGADEDVGTLEISDVHPAWMNTHMAEEVLPTAVRDGSWQGDGAFLHRDGREIPVSMSLFAHKGANGEVDVFYTVSRDITERKRTEEAREASEARLIDAQAVAKIGSWETDLSDLTITWSEELYRMFETDPGSVELSHQRFLTFVHPEDRARVDAAFSGSIDKDSPSVIEHRIVTPGGRVKFVEERWRIVRDDRGRPVRAVGTCQDITERRHLEAQFRQAQKMESVGQLASGIAHDFNNLLTVINGMANLVLAQVRHDDPVYADVEEIHRAGERAATLTRQLLAFSRQQILQPRVLSVGTVVAGMESFLQRLLGEDIDLLVVPTSDVGHVTADVGQLEQVLINLAVNARDAMAQGGKLTVEVQNVTIDEASDPQFGEDVLPGPYVRLVVSDTGVGMNETTRERIFEPFFTTKRPGKGTGLGLSTVFGIVKQSQGFIRVYSEVGQGTTFKIYLPRVTEPAADSSQPASTVMSRACTETVLVVEDSAGLRALAIRVLERAGYTVLGAATGEAALRLLERQDAPVHLLLTDVVMPGMGGRELAERLAETRPETKVLYMSGYTEDTVVRHGVLEGSVAFLNKPFTAAALLHEVGKVLDSRQ